VERIARRLIRLACADCRGEILRGGMCRTVEVGLMEENCASDDRRHIVLFDYTFALC
jgi:hypothetical protein